MLRLQFRVLHCATPRRRDAYGDTHPRNETFDDLPTRTNLKEKSIHSDRMVIETGTNNTAPCASLFQSLPGERRSFQARGYMPDKQPTPSQPPPFILPLLPSPPPHRTIMWPSRVSTSSATTHTPLSTPHPFHTIHTPSTQYPTHPKHPFMTEKTAGPRRPHKQNTHFHP